MDPEVLKACVPGCESIDQTGVDAYRITMHARIGPVSARFQGKLALSDLQPPEAYAVSFEGQGGAMGFGKGRAKVRLADVAEGTELNYTVEASVGGKLAQIGARLIDGAALKLADDFFGKFSEHLAAQQFHPQESPAPAALAPADALVGAGSEGGTPSAKPRWRMLAAAALAAATVAVVWAIYRGNPL